MNKCFYLTQVSQLCYFRSLQARKLAWECWERFETPKNLTDFSVFLFSLLKLWFLVHSLSHVVFYGGWGSKGAKRVHSSDHCDLVSIRLSRLNGDIESLQRLSGPRELTFPGREKGSEDFHFCHAAYMSHDCFKLYDGRKGSNFLLHLATKSIKENKVSFHVSCLCGGLVLSR